MTQVLKAGYRGDYKIWVQFNDGACGVADELEDFLWGPVFEPLLNKTCEDRPISSGR